jgi:D-xylose transport system substrate-binding protein
VRARVALVVLSCLLSVVTGLELSRGRSSERAKRKPLIGLSMDTLKEERWQHDRDLFVKRAEALGADVLVQAANSDDTRQLHDVESLLSRNVDALVVVAHNGEAMARAVELGHESGVPVIAYDRLIRGADVDLYVSFDAVKVGELQAKFLVEKLGGKGRIVRIHGAKVDNNAVLVKQGQDAVLAPYLADGRIKVVHEDWAENWKPEAAKKITNAAITRAGSAIDGVLAANDGTAGGAIQALTEEGLAGKVLVTGQDAELAACQRIVAGTQTMTVYKPLKRLAEAAAEAAYKLATRRPLVATQETENGKTRVPSILIDVTAAVKDNLDSTVIADGFHSKADVFRGASN